MDKLLIKIIELGFKSNHSKKYEKRKLLQDIIYWLETKHNLYIESIITDGPIYDLVIVSLVHNDTQIEYYEDWKFNSYEEAIIKGIEWITKNKKLCKKI